MFPVGISSFSQLYTPVQVAIYFGLSFGIALLLFFASQKFLLVFQLCGYKGRRYFAWVANPETPYLSRLMLLCLLGFLFFCVLALCFASLLSYQIASYVGFSAFLLFIISYINTESKVNAKVQLKKTARLIRLSIVYIFILTAVVFGLITLFNLIAFAIGDDIVGLLRFSLICALPIALPYILYFSSLLIAPFELLMKRYYVKKTTLKLKRSQVLKIGITGSYGKTSVKEILKVILSQKYRVLATPDSYNTPLGIAISVKSLDSTHDVFIAEMGARNKGDIKELVDILHPIYGVLTGINEQHLESFGSIENIKDTKFELFSGLADGGEGFFSSDSEGAVELYNRFNGIKYLAGLSSNDNLVSAKDIEVGPNGTQFKLVITGEEPVDCSTILLGKHSIKNICLASAVAYKIGLTPIEIANGINRIQSIGHRLEIMPNNKDIVIIDDSYNSNVDGFISAMEVLDTFVGRKIVVTPGLVELGKKENLANFEMGKILAKHADFVIVIGRHNAEMLVSGLIEGGMERDKIRFAKNLNRGNQELNSMLKAGDVVLFENDLPDNYS